MRNEKFYKGVFFVAWWYDLILGAAFFLFYKPIYSLFGIELPDNPAYLHMAAAFVFVQGIGYYFVYRNLERNIDLIKLGVVYKIIYTGVAFYYWGVSQLPHLIFALFGFLDLVFVVLFVLCLRAMSAGRTSEG